MFVRTEFFSIVMLFLIWSSVKCYDLWNEKKATDFVVSILKWRQRGKASDALLITMNDERREVISDFISDIEIQFANSSDRQHFYKDHWRKLDPDHAAKVLFYYYLGDSLDDYSSWQHHSDRNILSRRGYEIVTMRLIIGKKLNELGLINPTRYEFDKAKLEKMQQAFSASSN